MNKTSRILKFVKNTICMILIVASAILFAATNWAVHTFNVNLNAIINTLLSNLEGTSPTTVIPAVVRCAPIVAIIVVIAVIIKKISEKKGKGYILPIFAIVCVFLSFLYVQLQYDLIGYIKGRNEETTIYEDNYVDPREVSITAPEEKRNLIYIYLESLETTYADQQNGGNQDVNYMPELTQLAEENISFSNSETLGGFRPIQGAGWTMAAIYTSTSGVPFALPVGSNDMVDYDGFASGLYTIGDFLEEEGYNQEFLCGSEASFGGRENFFVNHGGYEIFDLYTAREKGYISEDYYEWWGYEDEILFEIAKDELIRLSAEDEPFNLTLLTADLHHIGGYVCDVCGDEYDIDTANVVACTDRQVVEFIQWIQKQDFYDNTTIVVVGDHPRMDNYLVEDVDYNERTIYNCFINSATEPESVDVMYNREFSAMDIFPSTLAAMGYEIAGNRLGLGTNMFSGQDTILERMGTQEANDEFTKKSTFYIEKFAPEMSYLVASEEESLDTIVFRAEGFNAADYQVEDVGILLGQEAYAWVHGMAIGFDVPIEDSSITKVDITFYIADTNGKQTIELIQDMEVKDSTEAEGSCNMTLHAEVVDGHCLFFLRFPEIVKLEEQGASEDEKDAIALVYLTITESK